jgi:endoglycosylceramidase
MGDEYAQTTAVSRPRRPRGRRLLRRSTSQRGGGPALRICLALAVVAVVVAAYIPVGTLAAHVPPPRRPAAQADLPWLSTAGGHVVDESGRTVLLRGFNSDTLLEDGVRKAPLDDNDLAMVRNAGFNVVRLPIAWSRIEPERGRIDSGYLDTVEALVRQMSRHGLYAVLDMHFLDFGPRFGGSGAPTWAALPLVPELPWFPSELWKHHLSPAQAAARAYFWLSPDWQGDYLAAWRAVATRLRDLSGVAGYDLYNEPYALPLPPRIFEQHWLWPLYARTITAIGEVDPNHLFVVEGTLFLTTSVRRLDAPGLLYSPHEYTGSLLAPTFDGDPGPLLRSVAGSAADAAAVPAVLWPGELGFDRSHALATQWTDTVLDAYDDLGVGWAWWQWREDRNWGVRDKDGGYVDTDFLHHLARPFLAAAPPGVSAGRGDGVRGTLRVSVAAGHGDAPVEVAWPAMTLGDPAEPHADCLAASEWSAQRARLVLRLRPGVGCTVTLNRLP